MYVYVIINTFILFYNNQHKKSKTKIKKGKCECESLINLPNNKVKETFICSLVKFFADFLN